MQFPLYSKISVVGADQHPLYAALTGKESPFPGPVKWNFTKFLIGRDGKIIQRYDSAVSPDDPQMVKTVQDALKSK